MRHRYECPMRWADLDMLGHVNNVTYLNYLREARVDFFAALGRTIDVDELDEGIRITRNQVVFVAPLLFRPKPITIELWTSDIEEDSFALNYEVFDETETGRVVYLRVRAELRPWVVATGNARSLTADERAQLSRYQGDPIEFSPVPTVIDSSMLPASYDLSVRLSDLDIYRRVSDVIYFEYFQEARVAYLYDLASRADEASALVIARTDIAYHQPVLLRREPYVIRSGVAKVGNSSFTVVGQILDDDTVVATAQVVLVGFDPKRQAAAPLTESQRAVLIAEYESV
ncbi:MAG: acyl-CoA thioesterase [Marmoricola sp.]